MSRAEQQSDIVQGCLAQMADAMLELTKPRFCRTGYNTEGNFLRMRKTG